MSEKKTSGPKDWLGISEAADYLGVHFTTLRRWSDDDKVPFYQTPGGQRRYKESDLDQFLAQLQRGKHPGEITLKPESAQPEIIQEIREMGMGNQDWYGQISTDKRKLMARNGRLLIGSLMQYACRQDEAKTVLAQGKELGEQYGKLCRQSNLSVIQTMQAFVKIRHSIVDSLCEAGIVVEDSGEDTWNIFRRVNFYLDTVMMAILESYRMQTSQFPPAFE